MKILQVIQKPQFRGAEIFACQLSVELIRLGHQVDILFLFGGTDERLPYPLHFIPLHANIKRRFLDLKAYKKLNTIITEGGYDIVQANAADTLKYCVISKVLYGWKSKLVLRNANKMGDFLNSKPKKMLNSFFVTKVDMVASVSEMCKEDFLKQFPFYKKSLVYLPIGIDFNPVAAYDSFAAAGISIGIGNVFVHVGSFVPEKNHLGLLAIFKKYLAYDASAKLLLIGEGKLKSEISKKISDNDLQENIFLLGKRNDVLKLMPLCKAFLLPSHIEGLPGVILEAMFSKIPVIAYDVGGVSEVLRDKTTGYLVEHNDEGGFVFAMISLNEISNSKMTITARDMIIQKFDNSTVAKEFMFEYMKLYNSI